MKRCLKCKQDKGLDEFFKDKSRPDRHTMWCKKCRRVYNQEVKNRRTAFGRNPGVKNAELKTRYGITLVEYTSMHEEQEGKCAICGSKAKLVVDHNHVTGVVRGLLCSACNRAIGHGNESPERFRSIADYLEERGSKHD